MTENIDLPVPETRRAANRTEPDHGTGADPMAWLDRHGDALYAYALLRVKEPATAEDLVQDSLLAALKSVANYRGESTERTWLTGILKHKIMDYVRKRYREIPLENDGEESNHNEDQWFDESGHWLHRPGHWESPEQSLENRQFWRSMNDCVEKLPESLRMVYVLREFDEMETDEIIETLGVTSRNNLWVMLSRARMQLRACLEINWFGN